MGLTCCICREGYRYQPQKVSNFSINFWPQKVSNFSINFWPQKVRNFSMNFGHRRSETFQWTFVHRRSGTFQWTFGHRRSGTFQWTFGHRRSGTFLWTFGHRRSGTFQWTFGHKRSETFQWTFGHRRSATFQWSLTQKVSNFSMNFWRFFFQVHCYRKLLLVQLMTECLKWRLMLRQMRESPLHQILLVPLAIDTHKIYSFDWPKWCCALWCYIISHCLLDQTSFQMVWQTGCR